MTDYRKETSDVVYFNARISNTTNRAIQSEFREYRGQNILEKASDYYMAIVRFSVPHTAVAIFDFDAKEYWITINTTSVQLIYETRGSPVSGVDANFRGIWTFQQMLDMINTAFNTAHVANGEPGNPPTVHIDAAGKFVFAIDTLYTSPIYLNDSLYDLFVSLDVIYLGFNNANHRDYQLIYKNNFGNIYTYPVPYTGTYYKIIQETKSQYSWSDVRDIVITSTSIPCKREYVGSANRGDNTTEVQAISDFIPIQTESLNYDRSPWLYNSGSGYRLINLESDEPLRQMDFKVSVLANDEIFTIPLAPGESIIVKFMFIKKSLVNNEYNGLVDIVNSKRISFTGINHAKRNL